MWGGEKKACVCFIVVFFVPLHATQLSDSTLVRVCGGSKQNSTLSRSLLILLCFSQNGTKIRSMICQCFFSVILEGTVGNVYVVWCFVLSSSSLLFFFFLLLFLEWILITRSFMIHIIYIYKLICLRMGHKELYVIIHFPWWRRAWSLKLINYRAYQHDLCIYNI